MRESLTKQHLDAAQIAQLARECRLGPVTECAALTDGFFNAAYRVTLADGGRAVLKVAPPSTVPVLRQERHILSTEVAALRQARSLGLPVPAVLGARRRSRVIDSAYVFLEWVDGQPLDRLVPALPSGALTGIYEQVGRYARLLHTQTAPYFGWFANGQGRFATWSAAFGRAMRNVLRDAADRDVPLPRPAADLVRLLQRHRPVLDEVRTPVLVHRDLWLGNLFVDPQTLTVTAVTDWERALYGDPLLEFVFGFVAGEMAGDGSEGFFRGYGRPAAFTHGEQRRLALYELYAMLLLLTEGYYRGYRETAVEERIAAAIDRLYGRLTTER